MLGDEVAVEVLQGHLGHGDPLLGVVTHGKAGALARHRHDVPAERAAIGQGAGEGPTVAVEKHGGTLQGRPLCISWLITADMQTS